MYVKKTQGFVVTGNETADNAVRHRKSHYRNTDMGYSPDRKRHDEDHEAKKNPPQKAAATPQVPQTPPGLGLSAIKYAIIPESLINKTTFEEAHRAAAFARKELRLPPVTIQWYCPYEEAVFRYGDREYKTFDGDRTATGMYDPLIKNTIFVRPERETVKLQKTVLHELYHVRQDNNDVAPSSETSEKFAYGYEHDCVMRFFEADKGELDDLYFRHLCGEDWSK